MWASIAENRYIYESLLMKHIIAVCERMPRSSVWKLAPLESKNHARTWTWNYIQTELMLELLRPLVGLWVSNFKLHNHLVENYHTRLIYITLLVRKMVKLSFLTIFHFLLLQCNKIIVGLKKLGISKIRF